MLLGIFCAFGTSVAWLFGNVFVQASGRAVGETRALVWALGIGGLLAGLAALLLDGPRAPLDRAALVWLMISVVSGLFAYAGLFRAFAQSELSLTVPTVSSWSLVAALLSLLVLGQRVRSMQLLGAAVVLVGILLVSVGVSRRKGPSAGPRGSLLPAVLAAVGFGIMVPAMGEASRSFGAFGAASVVYLVGLVLAIPVARYAGIDLRLPPWATWPLVLGAGVSETAGFVLLNLAVRRAPVAVVSPVASMASVLTVIYAAVVLRERPGPLALFGALVASVGVVVVTL